jgi:hypothetical protein
MMLTGRRAIGAGLLILTVGLLTWIAARNVTGDPQTLNPAPLRAQSHPVTESPRAPGSMNAPIDSLDRDPLAESTNDPFKAVNFLPVPQAVAPAPLPAPTAPVAPPAPVKPQFPYRYFGHMSDVTGKQVTYLTRDNAIIPIQLGAILDNVYRIDLIADNRIAFTYLPLNETFEISVISAAN